MIAQHVQDLEAAIAEGCQMSGCEHQHGPVTVFFFHGRCHPTSGVEARYRQGSGALEISCNVCSKPIVTIAVAK